MAKNKRKVYEELIEDGDEREARPCPACGCRHFERLSDGKRPVMRCRNCGRVR